MITPLHIIKQSLEHKPAPEPPRALSLTRPWDYCITHLGKTVENRSWKRPGVPPVCRYRGELYLHAAQSWDGTVGDKLLDAGLVPEASAALLRDKTQHKAGVIVARCRAVGHIEPGMLDGRPLYFGGEPTFKFVGSGGPLEGTQEERSAAIDWWHGGYALVLADIEPLSQPIPCKGALGIWRVKDPAVAGRLRCASCR